MTKPNYVNTNDVFINCPFTSDYKPLFECIVFTVLACGFWPRTSLEASDGGDFRLEKILRLVRDSAYSIHDLSAVSLDEVNKLPRFNMPFELGLVIGCKKLAGKRYASRSILILEEVGYTYQKCLSDIAGQDLRAHGGSAKKLSRFIRTWLSQESKRTNIPGDRMIFQAFNKFSAQLPQICEVSGLEYEELSYPDLLGLAQQWLLEQR